MHKSANDKTRCIYSCIYLLNNLFIFQRGEEMDVLEGSLFSWAAELT